jgi:hypothetical protein
LITASGTLSVPTQVFTPDTVVALVSVFTTDPLDTPSVPDSPPPRA